MRRAVQAMFRKDAPGKPRRSKPDPLPETVTAVIDGASIVVRQSAADEGARAIVMLPGGSTFQFSPEGAAQVIARAWPELAEREVAQATKRLGSMVATRHAQAGRNAADLMAAHRGDGPDCRPWRDRY